MAGTANGSVLKTELMGMLCALVYKLKARLKTQSRTSECILSVHVSKPAPPQVRPPFAKRKVKRTPRTSCSLVQNQGPVDRFPKIEFSA